MALSTYSEIAASVSDWLARGDLTAQVQDFIRLAENDINRRLRVRGQEKALSATMSSGAIAVPSDFLELKHAYVQGASGHPLEMKDAGWVYRNYPARSADGEPYYIAQDGGSFIFGPYPDADYTVLGTYYARPTLLSSANETNWITTACPELLLYGALWAARGYLADDARLATWRQLYEAALDEVRREGRRSALAGSPLRQMPE